MTRFIELPPGAVTRASEMREAANARCPRDGDVLLALGQAVAVSTIACHQLTKLGMPETGSALARMVGLLVSVLGVREEDLKPFIDAVWADSKDHRL